MDTPCAIAFGINDTELNTEQLITVRGDYNISSGQKVSFRYYHDAGVQATGTSPINPLYNSVSNQPSYQMALTHTWVITPTVVNTVTASVLWYTALFGLQDFTKATAAMPEQINISDGGANGGGFANVGGGTYPYGFPVGRNVGHFQLNDDFSWSKGTHTFKAGVNARYDQYTYSSIAQSAFVGTYSLGDLSDFANGKLGDTGNALSSFSPGLPALRGAAFPVSLGRLLRFRRMGRHQESEADLRVARGRGLQPHLRRKMLRADQRAVRFAQLSGRRQRPLQHHPHGEYESLL